MQESRSIPDLFSSLTGDLVQLVRSESELVRAEVSEKISMAGKAGVMLGVGAALLLGGFLVLLQAVVLALATAIGEVGAALVVGLAACVIGFILLRSAAAKVSPANLTPDRTARQLGKDAQLLKEQVR